MLLPKVSVNRATARANIDTEASVACCKLELVAADEKYLSTDSTARLQYTSVAQALGIMYLTARLYLVAYICNQCIAQQWAITVSHECAAAYQTSSCYWLWLPYKRVLGKHWGDITSITTTAATRHNCGSDWIAPQCMIATGMPLCMTCCQSLPARSYMQVYCNRAVSGTSISVAR